VLGALGGLLVVEIRPSGGVGRLGTSLVNIVLYRYQSSKIGGCIQAINASTFSMGHIQPEMFLGDGLERLKASLHGSNSLVVNVVLRDSQVSLRDFIDDSEGQVVGDGLSDYGGGSDSNMSIEFWW
jgi:hypothetical protein